MFSDAKLTTRTKADVAAMYIAGNNINFKNAEILNENNVNVGKQCSEYDVQFFSKNVQSNCTWISEKIFKSS